MTICYYDTSVIHQLCHNIREPLYLYFPPRSRDPFSKACLQLSQTAIQPCICNETGNDPFVDEACFRKSISAQILIFKYFSGFRHRAEPREEAGQDKEEDGESRAALLTDPDERFPPTFPPLQNYSTFVLCMYRFRQ